MKTQKRTKTLAAVLDGIKALMSRWNIEPTANNNEDRIMASSLYSRGKKPGQNTGPDHF